MQKLTILLADQEPLSRQSVRVMLELQGHRVETCTSGQEVLAHLIHQGKSVDILMLDLQTLVTDGLETLQLLRAYRTTQTLPIIGIWSGEPSNTLQGAGVNAFLSKPFKRKELLSVLSKVLEQRGSRPGEWS